MNKTIVSIYLKENYKDKLPSTKLFKVEQERLYTAIYNYTDYMPKSTSFAERCYQIANELKDRPKCINCNKLLKFKGYKSGYGKVCSKSCKG